MTFLFTGIITSSAMILHHTEAQTTKQPMIRSRDTSRSGFFRVSVSSSQGQREYMEDKHYIAPNKRFMAIFDGHGGPDVAAHCQSHFYHELCDQLAHRDTSTTEEDPVAHALISTIATLQDQILARDEWQAQGSTIVGIYVQNDQLWAVNLGDSRAVLSHAGTAVPLTSDHTPARERARIEALGGHVIREDPDDEFENPELQNPELQNDRKDQVYRINGILAVARAVGDRDLRPFVSSTAEVRSIARSREDDVFIVLASDGLWDVMTNSEAIDFVRKKTEAAKTPGDRSARKASSAHDLVQEALTRGSTDNITTIVLWFK